MQQPQPQPQPQPQQIRIHVHERGDRSLDGVLRLIEVAERQQPLSDVLAAMCADVSRIAAAEVVSAYLREPAPRARNYTLRANVGFPPHAIGRVHLRLGEGVVGFVAECLRPVSVATASQDSHYKHIPGLGEEKYPALLAVPILRGGAAAGVLVLQRRAERAFSSAEVALATALAALFAHALDRADARARAAAASGSSAARLRGVPVVEGAAMGRAAIVPTLSALAGGDPAPPHGAVDPGAALARLERDLQRARRRLRRAGGPAADRALANLSLILADRRFGERLARGCADRDPLRALSAVARDYARVPYRTAPGSDLETMLADRAHEVEDLCVLFYAALTGRRLMGAGTVVVAERLGAFFTLCAIARRAGALVLDGEVRPDEPAVAIARAAGVPLLSAVTGLFRWVRPGDLMIVDSAGGALRVNPPATAVARFRRRSGK